MPDAVPQSKHPYRAEAIQRVRKHLDLPNDADVSDQDIVTTAKGMVAREEFSLACAAFWQAFKRPFVDILDRAFFGRR